MRGGSYGDQVASGSLGGQHPVKGKVAEIRVIYYWKATDDEIWMLTVYSKSERDTIAAHALRKIAEEIQNG